MITMEHRPNKLVGGAEGLKRDAFVRACGKIAYLIIILIVLKYVECHLIRMPHAGDSDEMAQAYFNLCP